MKGKYQVQLPAETTGLFKFQVFATVGFFASLDRARESARALEAIGYQPIVHWKDKK